MTTPVYVIEFLHKGSGLWLAVDGVSPLPDLELAKSVLRDIEYKYWMSQHRIVEVGLSGGEVMS